mmetsp:Transcript_44541/g.71582  ORF Transcript_44541/g.71582 Transcript_44541/m.71582 type:complete len:330 (+) Transcript_44541:99-1088(+)
MGRDGLNTTVSDAESIRGTNPQFLIEKITRMKIYDDMYWKEHCFALNAEGIVDKAVELKYVAGVYGGNRRPSEFMCLLLKMLQIQPERSIVLELIANNDYKYVRVLGATYLRLTGNAQEIYQFLEPLLVDYRKIRYRNVEAKYEMKHVDEIVDQLLVGGSAFDIALPRIPVRWHLEKVGKLPPRKSKLEEMDFFSDDEEGSVDNEKNEKKAFLELEKEKTKPEAIAWKREKDDKSNGKKGKSDSRNRDNVKKRADDTGKRSDDEDSDDSHDDDRRERRRRRRDHSRNSSRGRRRDRSRDRDRRRRNRSSDSRRRRDRSRSRSRERRRRR